ncbi:MAG: universal stress protein [Haliea sp.]
MFKNILVPIDLAIELVSAQQLSAAKRFVESHGGKVTVLHVRRNLPGYAQNSVSSATNRKIMAEAEKMLETLAQTAGLSDQAELVLLEGNPARTILNHANKIGADLIIMASHDPNITDYLVGSTAAHVVQRAHCSMFIVRNLQDDADR